MVCKFLVCKLYISLNSAKSFVGKSVNLYLADGSVLVNVFLEGIEYKDSKLSRSLLVRPNKLRARRKFVAMRDVLRIVTVPVEAQLIKKVS